MTWAVRVVLLIGDGLGGVGGCLSTPTSHLQSFNTLLLRLFVFRQTHYMQYRKAKIGNNCNTMPLPQDHSDFWTEALQFTKTVHREVYPAIDPTSAELRRIASGKVVIITGAGSGFGEVSPKYHEKMSTCIVYYLTKLSAGSISTMGSGWAQSNRTCGQKPEEY